MSKYVNEPTAHSVQSYCLHHQSTAAVSLYLISDLNILQINENCANINTQREGVVVTLNSWIKGEVIIHPATNLKLNPQEVFS